MKKPNKVPGIFRVHGVNKQVAMKSAIKNMEFYKVDGKAPTKEQYETALQAEFAQRFKKMNPVAVSQPFSSPQLAYEYIALVKKTQHQKDYRDLVVMINIETSKLNQKTGMPMRKWVSYSEYKQSSAA